MDDNIKINMKFSLADMIKFDREQFDIFFKFMPRDIVLETLYHSLESNKINQGIIENLEKIVKKIGGKKFLTKGKKK